MINPLPGEVWCHQLPHLASMLRVIVVTPLMRRQHYVLLLDRLPVRPPFTTERAAIAYARAEWVPLEHQEIAR